jgi:hypothetical protein
MKKDFETEFFECVCKSDEHVIKFLIDYEDKELYTAVYLYQYNNIFKRIFTAIKYIFRCNKRYGYWDNCILYEEDIVRLRNLLNKIIE